MYLFTTQHFKSWELLISHVVNNFFFIKQYHSRQALHCFPKHSKWQKFQGLAHVLFPTGWNFHETLISNLSLNLDQVPILPSNLLLNEFAFLTPIVSYTTSPLFYTAIICVNFTYIASFWIRDYVLCVSASLVGDLISLESSLFDNLMEVMSSFPRKCIYKHTHHHILHIILGKIFWNSWSNIDARIIHPELVFNKHPWTEKEFNTWLSMD